MGIIDIDKLHKNVSSDCCPRTRNSGKTFTTVCTLANTILVCEEEHILYYINAMIDIVYIKHMIKGLFPEFDIDDITYVRNDTIKCLGKSIHFVKGGEEVRGYSNYIEIRDYDYYDRLDGRRQRPSKPKTEKISYEREPTLREMTEEW
jgi:hypothetical protein